MNKIFNLKNVAIAIFTLALGTFVALGASKLLFDKQETVTGNVVSFILNPEGKVDGAILDTGDQVKFGAETGEIVTANVQIGAPLTATGRAGTKSDFGREFHAQTVQIGEQTITIAGKPKNPRDGNKPGKGGRKGGRDERDERGDRPGKPHPPRDGDRPEKPRDGERPMPPNGEINDEPNGEQSAPNAENREVSAPETNRPAIETAKVSGNVKFVLVNREGKARAVILSGGEQLDLGREVENANLTIDANTIVTAEGEIAKSQFGTFVRPKVLSVGNQTFTFRR